MDLVSEQLTNGRRFRVLNIVDDFSRECVLQVADFSLSSQRVANEINRLAERRPLRKTIVDDNSPEFTSKSMLFWSHISLSGSRIRCRIKLVTKTD